VLRSTVGQINFPRSKKNVRGASRDRSEDSGSAVPRLSHEPWCAATNGQSETPSSHQEPTWVSPISLSAFFIAMRAERRQRRFRSGKEPVAAGRHCVLQGRRHVQHQIRRRRGVASREGCPLLPPPSSLLARVELSASVVLAFEPRGSSSGLPSPPVGGVCGSHSASVRYRCWS